LQVAVVLDVEDAAPPAGGARRVRRVRRLRQLARGLERRLKEVLAGGEPPGDEEVEDLLVRLRAVTAP